MAEKNLHQRLAEVMKNVTYIQKVPGRMYSMVTHDMVTAKCRPALLEAGVIYYPIYVEESFELVPNADASKQPGLLCRIVLETRFANIDNPADHIDVCTVGYGIDPQDKGSGKAMSYAIKYALLKALGLETGEDPDLDQVREAENSADMILELFAQAEDVDELETLRQQNKDVLDKMPKATLSMVRSAWKARKEELTEPPFPDNIYSNDLPSL